MRLKTLATHPVWREPRTVFGVWMLTGVIFAIVKLLIGKYNNYKIFTVIFNIYIPELIIIVNLYSKLHILLLLDIITEYRYDLIKVVIA